MSEEVYSRKNNIYKFLLKLLDGEEFSLRNNLESGLQKKINYCWSLLLNTIKIGS